MALDKTHIRSLRRMDQPPSGSRALRRAKREAVRAARHENKVIACWCERNGRDCDGVCSKPQIEK